MNVLIVGSNGQLGSALQRLASQEDNVIPRDIPELDITNANAVLDECRVASPDVIINAAAYTAVDKAESEPELARAINVTGVKNLAAASIEVGARLIHVSTDFVFDGEGSTPYIPQAKTSPISVYGTTKRDGELAVTRSLPQKGVVIRTAWLYSEDGNNFVKTMLRLMRERDEINVVADQTGTPTWARSLAEAIWKLAYLDQVSGTYHWTDGGQATWHTFAQAIQDEALALGLLGKKIPINAITTADYPTPAKRPQYSVLDCSQTHELLGFEPRDWRENLHLMLKGMTT